MSVSDTVDAGCLRRNHRAPAEWIAPQQVELPEVASQIVPDPLRAEQQREPGPGERERCRAVGKSPHPGDRRRAHPGGDHCVREQDVPHPATPEHRGEILPHERQRRRPRGGEGEQGR